MAKAKSAKREVEGPAIPAETGLRLCEEIRRDNAGKWYSFNGLWCWGCAKAAGGDPAKYCFANGVGNRGCAQVNRRFERE
jgi:hypothetical protein